MTGTMEFRPNSTGSWNQVIFWRGKTVEQVRDGQYPGAKIVKQGVIPRSLRFNVDYCQIYTLQTDGAGILCSLAEIP